MILLTIDNQLFVYFFLDFHFVCLYLAFIDFVFSLTLRFEILYNTTLAPNL